MQRTPSSPCIYPADSVRLVFADQRPRSGLSIYLPIYPRPIPSASCLLAAIGYQLVLNRRRTQTHIPTFPHSHTTIHLSQIITVDGVNVQFSIRSRMQMQSRRVGCIPMHLEGTEATLVTLRPPSALHQPCSGC